jgi:hypothetical protein
MPMDRSQRSVLQGTDWRGVWTSALFNEARSRHISDLTVSAALAIAKKDGYNFAGIVWSPDGPVARIDLV